MWRIALLLGLSTNLYAEQPTVDSIDYASPEKYLEISESLGRQYSIKKQATKLKADDDQQTVTNVLRWMETTLNYDEARAYQWRNYDTVVSEKCYASCADQAIVCGVLLKSAGIPVVWVKTMDVPWIWDFKRKRKVQSWSGHVFLEVYLDEKWVLLDPGAATVYHDYSPKSRLLPGNRFAYHKGNDPKAMIMSLQWDAWKEQTSEYFTALDESSLPVDPDHKMTLKRKCYVIANSPYYQVLHKVGRVKGLGSGPSFNTEYDRFLPEAKGHTVLIETHAGVPIVDGEILERYFPGAMAGVESGKTKINGTTLVFVDFEKAYEQIPTAVE